MSPVRRGLLAGALFLSALPLAAAGWWGASPWFTVRALQSAVANGDAATFSAHVDYPELRRSVRAALRARLVAEAEATPPASLKALGLGLALEFADRMVESAVSPETLGLVLAGTTGSGGWIETPGLSTLSMLAGAQLEIERNGLDDFALSAAGGEGPALLFRRDGLQWRLSGVRIPAEAQHADA